MTERTFWGLIFVWWALAAFLTFFLVFTGCSKPPPAAKVEVFTAGYMKLCQIDQQLKGRDERWMVMLTVPPSCFLEVKTSNDFIVIPGAAGKCQALVEQYCQGEIDHEKK